MKVETTIQSQTRKPSQITIELGRKGGIVVDKQLSTKSMNPVANSVVTGGWDILNRALVEANKESAEIKASVQVNAEEIAKTNATVQSNAEEIAKKANTDGHYPKLTAGFADNLVGRGEVTASEFTFRASAGKKSIGDDGAKITKIKGNSVAWNQMRKPEKDISGTQFTIATNGTTITLSNPTNPYAIVRVSDGIAVSGHTYLISCNVISNDYGAFYISSNGSQLAQQGATITSLGANSFIVTPSNATSQWLIGIAANSVSGSEKIEIKDLRIFDLTKMFGVGKEPKDIADFYSRIPTGVDIHAHNNGTIISMHTEAIKTVGFNQWDEQWELGSISFADGSNVTSTNQIRTKNYIPILPNQDYYWNLYGYVRCYDKKKSYLGGLLPASDNGWSDGGIIKASAFPEGTAYLRFWMSSSYGTTYKNDICFNLSHTGINNGKYKPYTPFERELSVIGNYFPNGMRSAGTAHDSIEWDSTKQKWVAVQRIAEVDMGTLSWGREAVSHQTDGTVYVFTHYGPEDMYKAATNDERSDGLLCTKYAISKTQTLATIQDKAMLRFGYPQVSIRDSAYTDAASFKAAMQGVMLYYELAEPIVTEIEESLNLNYYVEDFGTEEAISSVPSAPFSADIIYPFNAVDTIRNNELRIAQLESAITTLAMAVNSINE